VKLGGTSSVGQLFTHKFGAVSIMPVAEIDFIGDDWATLGLTVEVNLDSAGKFGTTTEN